MQIIKRKKLAAKNKIINYILGFFRKKERCFNNSYNLDLLILKKKGKLIYFMGFLLTYL